MYDLRFTSWSKSILFVGLVLCAVAAPAATVRLTTWNLQANLAAGTNGNSTSYHENLVQEASDVLKKLNSDIIVLQGVQDWQSCNELVKSLKPVKYNVAAWSSFRDAKTGTLSKQQVAILSKGKAYISWSEAWKNEAGPTAPGGFAFAAIRTGGKNLGVFSVQFGGDANAGENLAHQFLDQVDSLKNWTTNRIQALSVAGDFNPGLDASLLDKTLSRLESSGLVNAFADLPLGQRVTLPGNSKHDDSTADYIFTWDARVTATPEIVPTALTEHYPVTCDLDLDVPATPAPSQVSTPVARVEAPTPKPATPATNLAVKPASETHASVAVASNDQDKTWRTAGIILGGLLCLAIIWKLARRRPVERLSAVTMTMKTGEGRTSSTLLASERIVIAQRPVDTAGSAADHPPTVHIEAISAVEAQLWQRRAEEAERRAARATAVVRQGLMVHLSEWLKSKLVQRLSSDRRQLIETQRAAALKMQVVDERLAKIEGQLQDHNRVYEQRIDELEKELVEAREENRELIRAKIALVKAEMEKDRAEAARQSKGQR